MLILQSKSHANRSVTLLHTYVPKGQIPRLLELSQAQMTSHIKILSPPNHTSPRTLTSCRSWNSDMSSRMKPCVEISRSPIGKKANTHKLSDHTNSGSSSQFFYVLPGSLPLFLSTQSLHDSIPYLNEPSHVPVLNMVQNVSFPGQASTGLITTSSTQPPVLPSIPHFLRVSECARHWSYNSEQDLVSVLEGHLLSRVGRHGRSQSQSAWIVIDMEGGNT